LSEEEKSYLCCETCGTFYEEGTYHDCQIHESEEILAEREWIERNKEKSEEEEIEERIKPLTEKKTYKELLHASVLELAREDLERTGKVLSEEQYIELAKKSLLKQALKEKYPEVQRKERLLYYRSLRDEFEAWKKRLFGKYKDTKGQNLYLCPVCNFGSKQLDETFRHFSMAHPTQYQWYLRVSSLLEGRYDYYRYPDYYPRKEAKEEKAMDALLDKKEQLSATAEDGKAHLRNLAIATALLRRKEE